MNKRWILTAMGALAALPIIGAAAVVIGNNTGTQAERCDRFWLSEAASRECKFALADAAIADSMSRSAALQDQSDRLQRSIETQQQRVRDVDRAMSDLQSRR